MTGASPMRHRLSACAAIALVLAACAEPAGNPAGQPDPAAVLPGDIVSDCGEVRPDALRDVCVLSHDVMAGRLVGTEGNALARTYLIERFAEAGLRPVGEDFVHAFDFQRAVDFRTPDGARETFTGYNLIGVVPGADRSQALAVTAHYDHVGPGEAGEIYNGADDNASGVGALLAIAEHFRENPPRNDVLIIAFDAEEGGLNGARAFVSDPPEAAAPVALNFNVDMLGYSPDGDVWAAGTYHTPELLPVVDAAAGVSPLDLKAGYDRPDGDPRNDWTLLSDHGPFHVEGLPFLYLGVEDHEHYHQPSDEFAIIDPAFYEAAVATAVDLAERLDAWLSEAE
ncbi:MAG: M20/M25/M40 family metallo-hydrolase [Oceanicaulis sp.]